MYCDSCSAINAKSSDSAQPGAFEALCVCFIEPTAQRAILVHWDQGFLKCRRPSQNARMNGAGVSQTESAQEPFSGILAADAFMEQCFDGLE